MRYKSIFIIGLLIGLLSFSMLTYTSKAQFYLNMENLAVEEDPNIVTRRNLILNFLRVDYWAAGAKGFSNGIGGNLELSRTFEGISAVTSIAAQYKGMSLDFLFFMSPTAEYINSHWNITLKAYGKAGKYDVDLYSTFYAVFSLDHIGYSVDSSIIDYVDGLQNADGGFGSRENESSSLSATFRAILLLKRFGRLDLSDNVTDWIIQTQNLDTASENFGAFSSNKSDPTYTVYSSYEAIASLYLTNGSFSSINVTAIAQWIASLQNLDRTQGHMRDYGGFGNPNDIRSSMPCSRAAVSALNLLNKLHLIRSFDLIVWVFSCQPLLYGGFASSPATRSSTVSATYHALEILKVYNWPMILLYTQIPWQLKPDLHWFLYFLIIVTMLAISLVIIRFIWKQRKKV